MKKIYIYITAFIILVILISSYFVFNKQSSVVVTSFETCAQAGYIIMESYPRQCITPDGRTYAEEIPEKITYHNASTDLIKVETPYPGAVTGKEFSIVGEARGTWYFEASFPLKVLDKDGKILFQGPVQAEGEWMTQNFVPFKVDIKVPQSYIGKATIVLSNDNPSGLPENDKSISFPITIEY
ncbi:MAG TPA: Gmad2 immunoglobulin-like domain-containing protein [Candidatus Paceibacterota bacterium]